MAQMCNFSRSGALQHYVTEAKIVLMGYFATEPKSPFYKSKNKDLDRWRSTMRSPHEGVFSKLEKRARYRGIAKVQFQLFMEATVWNTKRLVRILAPPILAGA